MTHDVERFLGADGRRKVIAQGIDASLIEMADMLAKGGAKSIEIGWTSPLVADSDDDPPPGVPVTWYCEVEWHRDRRPTTRGESTLTTDHRRGVLEAVADVLRELGANVTIMEALPDDARSLS